MLRLMLLRHAKSSWDEPGIADRDRQLSPRGRRAAALMGAEFATRGLQPDKILCSPARRTRETLAALLPHLTGEGRIAITAELYEPASKTYEAAIGRRAVDARRLLVIGHNPAIQETALALVSEDDPARSDIAEKLPAGSLVVIDLPAENWAGLERGSGRVALYLKPRDLEADRGFEPIEGDD
jgi:phosphohistidine phosphatase